MCVRARLGKETPTVGLRLDGARFAFGGVTRAAAMPVERLVYSIPLAAFDRFTDYAGVLADLTVTVSPFWPLDRKERSWARVDTAKRDLHSVAMFCRSNDAGGGGNISQQVFICSRYFRNRFPQVLRSRIVSPSCERARDECGGWGMDVCACTLTQIVAVCAFGIAGNEPWVFTVVFVAPVQRPF